MPLNEPTTKQLLEQATTEQLLFELSSRVKGQIGPDKVQFHEQPKEFVFPIGNDAVATLYIFNSDLLLLEELAKGTI